MSFILCKGIRPRHVQHNGLSTSSLGGMLFQERPRPWALPYIECAILELVGFHFNAHLFIFLGFLVCVTSRAKWMFVSPVSRFGFAHCEWILRPSADCDITFKFGHFLDFQVEDGCCFLGRESTLKFNGRSEADLSSTNPSSICMTKRWAC